MKNSLQKSQAIVEVDDDILIKSADALLTVLSAPQTQSGVRVKDNFTTADRGVIESIKKPQNRNFIEFLSKKNLSKDAKSTIKAYNLIKNTLNWRGNPAIPPANFLENITAVFKNETDIPLELPFFAGINFIAAHLLFLNVCIDFSGQIIKPDIWTIALAESGSAKTFAFNIFEKAIDIKNILDTGIQSSAKFIEELQKNNNAFWIRDEFAQLLKAMKTQSYLEELKDYLLKSYDNKTISRKTLKHEIIVENPALVLFGLSVYSTFLQNVSLEDMLDGFAQRPSYVIAKNDPERPELSVALYPFNLLRDTVKKSWKKIKFPAKNKKYILGQAAVRAFEDSFYAYAGTEYSKIPASFLRRTLFKSIKYALIYHIVLGKTKYKEIDAEDISWAMRLITLHISDTKEILENYGLSDLEKTIQKVENLKRKFAEAGKIIKARDIIANVKEIKNVNEAKAILELI